MDDLVRLSLSETVGDRPFTDLDHNAEDPVAIHGMMARLRLLLSRPSALPGKPRPLVVNASEPNGRQHRVIICSDERLRAAHDLAFVGFFAQKRRDRDCSPLTVTDDELVLEFPHHPGILSYSSLELADSDWANLIIVDPPEAKDHWRTSERHAFAVREVAPRYYTVVRLHNGLVPGGLVSGRDAILVRTKYYDFQGSIPWRAERELRPT